MELKYGRDISNTIIILCSNRTFMELKWTLQSLLKLQVSSSNRTFMELKSE